MVLHSLTLKLRSAKEGEKKQAAYPFEKSAGPKTGFLFRQYKLDSVYKAVRAALAHADLNAGKRQAVKVLPMQPLQAIVEQVAAKQKPVPALSDCALLVDGKTTDLSTPLRYANISSAAKLEVTTGSITFRTYLRALLNRPAIGQRAILTSLQARSQGLASKPGPSKLHAQHLVEQLMIILEVLKQPKILSSRR